MSQTHGTLPQALKVEYLETVASWFLDEWRATEDDMVRETDTPYTRGTTRFGRQKQRITLEYMSGRHNWLRVENNGLDIVFSICNIPFRFSNDDADAPRKRAVLQPHIFQIPLLEEAQPDEAARFVFVIDRGMDEVSDPRVVVLGFTQAGEEACRWTSGAVFRQMGNAHATLPAAIEIPKPAIKTRTRDVDSGDSAAAAEA